MMKIKLEVYQDGADFYNAFSGECIFTAPIKVLDHDMTAASRAQAMFIEWCEKFQHKLDPEFGGV